MMNMVYHKDGRNGCYIAGPFKIPVAMARSLKEAEEAWNRRVNDGMHKTELSNASRDCY